MLWREKGFTLVELVITTGVLGLAILAIGTMFTSLQVVNRDARTQTIAIQAAQQEMEIVRNTAYSKLTVGTTSLSSNLNAYPLLPGPKTMQLVVSQFDPAGLRQADVVVTYAWHKQTKTVKLTTLVASVGMNH